MIFVKFDKYGVLENIDMQNEVIFKGNNRVNKVFVVFDGYPTNANYYATYSAKLNNGEYASDLSDVAMVRTTYKYKDVIYNGYQFSILSTLTTKAGNLDLSIRLVDRVNNAVLVSGLLALVVQDTAISTFTSINISETQYQAILEALTEKATLSDVPNVIILDGFNIEHNDYYSQVIEALNENGQALIVLKNNSAYYLIKKYIVNESEEVIYLFAESILNITNNDNTIREYIVVSLYSNLNNNKIEAVNEKVYHATKVENLITTKINAFNAQITTYINQHINNVINIAEGKTEAKVYEDYQLMVNQLNGEDVADSKVGDPFYIVKLKVPDLWVARVNDFKTEYTYIDDLVIVNELLTKEYIDIGWYRLAPLETQKVDLSAGQYTSVEWSSSFKEKNWEVSTSGVMVIDPDTYEYIYLPLLKEFKDEDAHGYIYKTEFTDNILHETTTWIVLTNSIDNTYICMKEIASLKDSIDSLFENGNTGAY